ncbi:type II toxin-antitoxin system VapB15 family antitoxin [Limnospira fusiformis]|uniref:type II toxin-antitoxin system VapB15 family antitoxin n=1 Tax=Limnospira fusiformis TaxID=54297 RepID=UPI0034E09D26
MNPTQYQPSLSFEQVLSLVKQLPEADKLKLSEALSKDLLDSKLTYLFQCFKTDELSLAEITQEVEAVRTEIQDEQTAHFCAF